MNLDELNADLAELSAEKIIKHFYQNMFGRRLAMTSSFGADSAVLLHMATQIYPGIRVIFVDTGYHFPETLEYVETLSSVLSLDVHTYRAEMTPGEMEKEYGKLWELGNEGMAIYNSIRKVQPLRNALDDLRITGTLRGIRKSQTEHRKGLRYIEKGFFTTYKIHPMLDWLDDKVREYMRIHNLPDHPLFSQGYTSIGDWHSTVPNLGRAGRNLGEHQECGINFEDYVI